MILLITILLLVSCAVLAICAYMQSVRKRSLRIILISVRSTLVIAFFLALQEPTFRFERLANDSNTLPVLIDASASMRLFHPDSTILPFLRMLTAKSLSSSSVTITPQFFLFGDSIRKCKPTDTYTFSDRQSIFPSLSSIDAIKHSPMCIIVSDGNFSNMSLSSTIMQDKTYFYLPLAVVRPAPFLKSEIRSSPSVTPVDSPAFATIRVNGFAIKTKKLVVTLRNKTNFILQKLVAINAGYFSDTVSFRLPTTVQGRFLYSISTQASADSECTELSVLHSVVPQKFSAKTCSALPSLDQRFLRIALLNDPQWQIDKSYSKTLDAIFCFDFNQSMRDSLLSLSKSGIVVFLGEPPCDKKKLIVPADFSIVQNDAAEFTTNNNTFPSELPPPATLFSCASSFLTKQQTVLRCVFSQTHSKQTSFDTLPFCVAGFFEIHPALAIPARELWRTDFWPQSANDQNGKAALFQVLLGYIKNQLGKAAGDNFIVYPAVQQIYEGDSIALTVLFPNATAGAAIEHPVIHYSIPKVFAADKNISVFMKEPANGIAILPPLKAGTYGITFSYNENGRHFTYTDSLFVNINNDENAVTGQNVSLLNQLAAPLGNVSAQTISKDFLDAKSRGRNMITDEISVHKSGILIGIILVLLCSEWFLRRKNDLD